MKEVVENCTEAYRGHDIRLVLQVLLKRHTQVQREDVVAISAYVLGLAREKSMGGRNTYV